MTGLQDKHIYGVSREEGPLDRYLTEKPLNKEASTDWKRWGIEKETNFIRETFTEHFLCARQCTRC